jgi:hypothetical protein
MKSGQLVLVGGDFEIFLEKSRFLFLVRDYLIRNHSQVGIWIVQESNFPVHQPNALSIEKDIVGLE